MTNAAGSPAGRDRPHADVDAVPVLILNFNGWDDTFANIATMAPYVPNIWLIDNGSDDDRTEEARRRFPVRA